MICYAQYQSSKAKELLERSQNAMVDNFGVDGRRFASIWRRNTRTQKAP